jgi:septal ring factor EnvC (AmiA/AmiB activator)
MQKIVHEKD